MQNPPIWDLPTRLFHWLLVVAVLSSWLSHELEWIQVHQYSGYSVLVLVGFRLLWGMCGSVHSRFADFVHGPRAVWLYLRRGEWAGVGHNPAGGWSVIVLLLLLLVQSLSGLFNSDGLMFDGPLYHVVDSYWSDQLGALHEQLFWILVGVIGLHLLAVSYQQFVQRRNIIVAMLSGGAGGKRAPVPQWRALLVLALCVLALAVAINLAPEPEVYW